MCLFLLPNVNPPLLLSQGKFDEAGPLYERSLVIHEKVYGPDHPAVATALNNRAGLLSICYSAFKSPSFDNTFLPVLFPCASGEVCRGGATV